MAHAQSSRPVRRWMHAPVHVAHPLDSIAHARALCERHRVNQLPVVVDDALVGIVTDRDLRDAFPSLATEIERPADARQVTERMHVEDVMSRSPVTVTEADGIEAAATLMRRERIGALPVVRGDHLVGILTRTDLLGALIDLGERPL